MAEPIPPSTSGDLDPDPRSLDIPDGLTFGAIPSTWRLALAGNRQLVYLVSRDGGHISSMAMDAAGARKLGEALIAISEQATGANTPQAELLVPAKRRATDLLIPTLDTSQIPRG